MYNMMRFLTVVCCWQMKLCYGKRSIPSYHFDNAKVIVSLGADFLGTWLNPVNMQAVCSRS